jgi:hypothetical protein
VSFQIDRFCSHHYLKRFELRIQELRTPGHEGLLGCIVGAHQ